MNDDDLDASKQPSASADDKTWAIVAGGGTAGHVHPGLAIAEALVERGHPRSSIHYIGSDRGIEERLVPPHGFSLTTLPGRGIQRRLTAENVGALVGLSKAGMEALGILRRRRPKVLVALGGYASVPAAVAARLTNVPVVVAEQNAVPGLANKLVSRWAKASAVSFPNTALPRAVVTGNPVRPEILEVRSRRDRGESFDTQAVRASLGVEAGQKLLVVYGGSLGARTINEAVRAACTTWADRTDLCIRHIIGRRDWDRYRAAPHNGVLRYVPIEYEDDMPTVLAVADLVLCRSGASSVAELAVLGTPSVLIPLPGAPGDHQTANARALTDRGAAEVIVDGELDAERLVAVVDRLLSEPETLAAMAAAAREVGRPNAAREVADLVEEYARD